MRYLLLSLCVLACSIIPTIKYGESDGVPRIGYSDSFNVGAVGGGQYLLTDYYGKEAHLTVTNHGNLSHLRIEVMADVITQDKADLYQSLYSDHINDLEAIDLKLEQLYVSGITSIFAGQPPPSLTVDGSEYTFVGDQSKVSQEALDNIKKDLESGNPVSLPVVFEVDVSTGDLTSSINLYFYVEMQPTLYINP